MNRNIFIFLMILSIFSFSCKKESKPTDYPATVTIISPIVLTIFPNGTSMNSTGEMRDNNSISQARVEIRNKSTNALFYQQETSVNDLGIYNFSWTWKVTGITATTIATRKVICKNKQGNEVSATLDVTLES